MNKRKMPQETEKPMCKFGKGCYRTNPKHLEEFQHPGDEEKVINLILTWAIINFQSE